MADSALAYLRNIYGSEALDWFDVSYIGDWLFATLLWFIGEVVDMFPVYERNFALDDPLISFPHTKQQIGGKINNTIALFVPLIFIVGHSVIIRSLIHLHHGALGLWAARALTHFITESIKNRIGRLRPDFLARCKWGVAINACTGKFSDVADGRKSFPSGHSSTIFCGMFYLFLWSSAWSAAWSFATPLPPRNPFIFSSRLGRLCLTVAPLILATWVAISRVEDYRHHKEDVIVGSIIGIASAAIGYSIYWPNPFSERQHAAMTASLPRRLYRNNASSEIRNNGYELARLEENRDFS